MLDIIFGAVLIMLMRICDVTIGTIRTIQVIHGRKYLAGLAGFFEVLIWIFAMRYIVQHLDEIINLFGYATGFALGNIIGITIEQRIGMGFLQLNIISKHFTDKIATDLRKAKIGVTVLPGEGGAGGVSILVIIIKRKFQKEVINLVESIDPNAFITVQPSIPYRGYIHGARK
jgi:uncharacterized protein YebE (UPF0316 family)